MAWRAHSSTRNQASRNRQTRFAARSPVVSWILVPITLSVMFSLFGKGRKAQQDAAVAQQAATVLAECEATLTRIFRMSWSYIAPRDVAEMAERVQRATDAGLHDHETVRGLDFCDRLWHSLRCEIDADAKDSLLAEGERIGLGDLRVLQEMRHQRGLDRLRDEGPSVIERDSRGRSVYWRSDAQFKNKTGALEIRDDGLTFAGEVMGNVAWSDVAHAAKTSHTCQSNDMIALALQEGTRRTATKFAFPDEREGDRACEIAIRLWQGLR